MEVELPTVYKCEVCAGVCPAYISHDLDIRTKEWRHIRKIHSDSAYFLKDKMFCNAECCLKWWQKQNGHT